MPTSSFKVLAQSNPSATTATNIYTVGASTQTVISTITVANLTTSATSFRIAIRPDGETLANKHYIAYDVTLGASDTTALTLGITLDAADVVTVYAGSASVAFNIFGTETV